MIHRLQKHKFDRLAFLHRPDCEAIVLAPDSRPDDEAAVSLQTDGSITYAIEVRPIYEALRRVVGQIAGLLILAQLTRRHEVLELPELAACQARCAEASERLKAVPKGAGQAAAHLRLLEISHGLCQAILETFPQWRRSSDPDVEFCLMEERLRAAYRYLSAGSWDKGGLSMIDFRHACCSCEASKLDI